MRRKFVLLALRYPKLNLLLLRRTLPELRENLYKMEISNTSHPFYTGKMKLVDTAGRVDKFMSRYAKRYDKKNAK